MQTNTVMLKVRKVYILICPFIEIVRKLAHLKSVLY